MKRASITITPLGALVVALFAAAVVVFLLGSRPEQEVALFVGIFAGLFIVAATAGTRTPLGKDLERRQGEFPVRRRLSPTEADASDEAAWQREREYRERVDGERRGPR